MAVIWRVPVLQYVFCRTAWAEFYSAETQALTGATVQQPPWASDSSPEHIHINAYHEDQKTLFIINSKTFGMFTTFYDICFIKWEYFGR